MRFSQKCVDKKDIFHGKTTNIDCDVVISQIACKKFHSSD